MATAHLAQADDEGPAAPVKKPTRVAQIGARIKSVAAISERYRGDSKQKRPAPALPPEAKRGAEKPQELNSYAASKASGESTAFLDLARSLGELRAVGEKGHKQLLSVVLPHLAQYEVPPASIVPQLVQLATATADRKLVRLVYYLLQLILGSGAAGTPAPVAGAAQPAVVSLPAEIYKRAWEGVLQPETPPPLTDLQLRTLSAAARAIDGSRLDAAISEAVRAVLERAEAGAGLGAARSKGQQREQAAAWELHSAALASTRAALQGRTLSKLAVRSSLGIVSPYPSGALHALALLTGAMRENAAAVFKEDKELSGLVAATASGYEASEAAGASQKGAAAGQRRVINLSDKWARVEAARMCAAAVYADWTSTQDFVRRVGAPFWRLLTILATRDREHLVSLEAIRAIFGHVHRAGRLQGPAATAEDARNVKLRIRAWTLFTASADKPVGYEPEVQAVQSQSLAKGIGERVKECLNEGASIPLRCTACRVAGGIFEAAARAAGRGVRPGKESGHVQGMLQELAGAVAVVARGPGPPALRSAAMEALLWRQGARGPPSISLSGLEGSVGCLGWSRDQLQALFECIYQVLRVVPPAARHLLQAASALARGAAASVEPESAAPSVQPDQLLELWSTTMKLPDGKPTALAAALSLLSSPRSALDVPVKGLSVKMKAQAAANEAGWLELMRNTAWWLGENANLACNEFAGSLPLQEQHNDNEAPEADTSPLETAALQAFRNPGMAAVISHLQHAVLTSPSSPRTAATQALAKIAVRSEEPYRLQCYAILASLDTSHQSSAPDIHGVACVVEPVLPVLDKLYSSRLVLEKLAAEYGRMPQRWPPAVVAQLRQRNELLELRISRVICSLSSASFFVLGPLSRDLLTSGVDSLAYQPSLSTKHLAELKTAVSLSSQDTAQSPLGGTARHSRTNSLLADPANPLLAGPDPLAALTENLNQQITVETFKKRAPAPWELNVLQPPTTIPEEAAFGFGDGVGPDSPLSHLIGRESEAAQQDALQPRSDRGVALHAFDAETSDELSVGNGEEVTIEAEADGWLQCVNRYNIRGFVPASYIRVLGDNESPADIASQLFGGYGAPKHQREKSLDLLNQPDMLSAFLAPADADDDGADDGWGGAPAIYHTTTHDPAQLEDDFEAHAANGGGDVDGDMAIPEPAPYSERSEEAVEQAEDDGSDTLERGSSFIPNAPDNPFGPEDALEPAEGDLDGGPSSSARRSDAMAPTNAVPAAGAAAETWSAVPRVVTPGPELEPTGSQPLSARIEHDDDGSGAPQLLGPTSSAPTSARSLAASTSWPQPLDQAPSSRVNEQPPTLLEPSSLPPLTTSLSRRLSRQPSRDTQISLPRQPSIVGSPGVRHMRQASYESIGNDAGAWHSRQSSMDLSLTSVRGTVLYEFVAETDDELTVAPGDVIVIQAEVDGWFQVTRASDGRRGLIPASYASPVAPPA